MGNKILFSAEPDTNYVFHMLSVAKCGYDNAYGAKYRGRYDPADLGCIKEQETRLTVRGGQHCGSWYGPMVCAPAQGEVTARAYYEETIAWLEAGRVELPPGELSAAIRVCRVMAAHYDDFISNIWPAEKEKIEKYIVPLRAAFATNGFTERAEEVTGILLPTPSFTAALVSSIEGGAEAIDISPTHGVLGIGRGADAEIRFICHEFIIYLLKHALKEEDAFGSPYTWALTEGLAEYYLRKIDGQKRPFQFCGEQAEMYMQMESAVGKGAKALYRAALERARG